MKEHLKQFESLAEYKLFASKRNQEKKEGSNETFYLHVLLH